jgi:anthranilate phosphoribosyltransferase
MIFLTMNIITETAFVNSTPKERVRKAGRGRVSAGKFIRSVLEKLNVPVKNNRNQEANTNYTDLYPFYTELNLWHTCFILT